MDDIDSFLVAPVFGSYPSSSHLESKPRHQYSNEMKSPESSGASLHLHYSHSHSHSHKSHSQSHSHSNSDRFIPCRSSNDIQDCFNLNDGYNHSPLSILRNTDKHNQKRKIEKNKKRKKRHWHPNDSSSDSSCSISVINNFKKYDECLQGLLYDNNDNSDAMDDIHLSECNVKDSTHNSCICDHIIEERIFYSNSPKKVYRFSDNHNNLETINSISGIPEKVQSIMSSSLMNEHNTYDAAIVANSAIKSIELAKQVENNKQLRNDYYFHAMDFICNQNMGCIAIDNEVYMINGHFGDLNDQKENIDIATNHYCSVKLNANSNSMLLGDSLGRLFLYDYLKRKVLHQIVKSNDYRISVIDCQKQNGKNGLVCVGSLDKVIRIYDNRRYKQIVKLKYHRGEVCGLKWNECNDYLLISGGNQNHVICWDIRKCKKPLFVGKHKAAIRALAWHPTNANTLVSGGGSNDQSIKMWNLDKSQNECIKSLQTGSQVCNLQYLQFDNHNYLLSTHGFSSNSVIVWDDQLRKTKQLSGHKSRVLYLSKYSDGNIVTAAAGHDQTLKYWKIFPNQKNDKYKNIIR